MSLNHKRFNSLRVGRINARAEARKHLLLRNNLEKRFNKNLKTLFRKFVNVQLYLYKQYGIYEPSVAVQALNEDFIPLLTNHYRKTFQAIYKLNEDKYFTSKNADVFVFGRSVDIENLVAVYFATRQIQLSGISVRMANQISQKIEEGRYAGLTLESIANLVSKEMQIISTSRAALIARTETHNAASYANNSYFKEAQQALGINMVKKWVATNDARTRPSHAAANGQTVSMDETFNIDGAEMEYAGDTKGGAKNVINCRCVIVYADAQDIVLD